MKIYDSNTNEEFAATLAQAKASAITELKQNLIDSNYDCLQEFASRMEREPIAEWLDQLELSNSADISALVLRLKKIEASLALIDTGMYGLCADCENPIEAERLNAAPWSQRCSHCAHD